MLNAKSSILFAQILKSISTYHDFLEQEAACSKSTEVFAAASQLYRSETGILSLKPFSHSLISVKQADNLDKIGEEVVKSVKTIDSSKSVMVFIASMASIA